ncbi:hypothetical protein PCLA_19r0023 [Pseudomonas citronellolis]|nr:hypothetical protein PCLA_19r0023 [Pseudomonas citronellolis]
MPALTANRDAMSHGNPIQAGIGQGRPGSTPPCWRGVGLVSDDRRAFSRP